MRSAIVAFMLSAIIFWSSGYFSGRSKWLAIAASDHGCVIGYTTPEPPADRTIEERVLAACSDSCNEAGVDWIRITRDGGVACNCFGGTEPIQGY